MNEKQNSESGFYIRIEKELKRDFNMKCLEKGANMTEVIKEYMKKYIEQ